MPQHAQEKFPTTHWTLIARLRGDDQTAARRALDELCAQYHYPLYCYIRRRGFDHHDAEDALHDFLAKLLRLEVFADAQAAKGRLRSLLATALQRFLINWKRDQRHRAHEISVTSGIDERSEEERYLQEKVGPDETPERLYERKWGFELMQRVRRRLGEQYASKGKGALYETLRPVLLAGGSLRGEDSTRLAKAAGISEGALRVALSRLLRDFRELLEVEVFLTVSSHEEVEEEIGYLLQLFQKK